jgi:hypothetical protein
MPFLDSARPWIRFGCGRHLPGAAAAKSDLSHSSWLGRSCIFSQAEIIGADMKDVLCLVTIALTALCFVLFFIAI